MEKIFVKNIMILYGKRIASAIVLTSFIILTGYLITYEWMKNGVAPDQEKMGWEESIFSEEPPILDVRCQRVKQGEKVFFNDLATAYDGGKNISNSIVFERENGESLEGKLNTDVPGIFPLIVSVKSKRTGKAVRKKVIILVDGSM